MASFDEYKSKLDGKYKKKKEVEKSTSNSNSSTNNNKTSSSQNNDFASKRKELQSKYLTSSLDSNGANEWFTEARSVLNRLQSNRSDPSTYTTSYGGKDIESARKLLESSHDVWKYMYSNKNSLTNYKDLDSEYGNLTHFLRQATSHADDVNEYYSQWETEDEYKDALKQSELYDMSTDDLKPHLDAVKATDEKISFLYGERDAIQTRMRGYERGRLTYTDAYKNDAERLKQIEQEINNLETSKVAYTTLNGENITWQSLYDRKKQEEEYDALLAELSANEDWEEQSQYITTNEKGTYRSNSAFDWSTDWDYEDVNKYVPYATSGGFSRDTGYANTTTDDEKAIFNYLYHTQGKDAAMEWHKSRENIYKQRVETQGIKDAVKFAEDYPVLSDIMSVAGTVVSAGEAVADVLRGDIGDTNQTAAVSSAIRSTRMEQIDWEVGGWDAFDFIYSTGMSTLDSIASTATFGKFGGVALGLSAAAQGTNDALNRGMSKGQAFASGLASGIFEGVFESWQIGAFDDLAKNLKRADFRNIAKYVGKNMWNNAKEETLTEIANIAYDTMINGEFSQAETAIRQLMQNGMSEAEAKQRVAVELGAQVIEAGASGALMGLGFATFGNARQGGAIATVNRIAKEGKAVKNKGEVGSLVDLGKSLGEGTESYDLANKVTDKSSALAIGSLLEIAEDDILSANRGEIVKSLERKGYDTKKANRLADLMLDSGNSMFANSRGITSAGKTYSDIIANPDSTVNQRTQKYIDILDKLEKENTDKKDVAEATPQTQAFTPYSAEYVDSVVKEFEDMGMPTEHARILAEKKLSAPTEGKSLPTEENLVESKFEVSAEGKTINTQNDEIVNIKNIESISNDGEANLTLDDGMVVKASDLSFGSDAEALFVENIGAIKVGKNPISTNTANALYQAAMSAFKSNPKMTASEAMSLIKGLTESYVYGTYNLGRSKLTARNEDGSATLFAGELSQEQRAFAYELGTQDAVSKTDSDQKVIDNLLAKAKPKASRKSIGKVVYEKGAVVDESALTATQKANLDGIKLLAEISSVEFHVFRSDKVGNSFKYTMPDGTVTGANGWFVAGTNEIWIDLNAGNAGEGTMLRTAAHEISHYIKQWSPQKWRAMADLMMSEFAKNGVDTESMLNRQISKIKRRYKANKKAIPSQSVLVDMAHEELVCDALSDMLTDGSVVNFMAEVKAKDRNLAQKILDAIKSLLNKWGLIIDDYKDRELDTPEAQALSQLEDTFKKLQEMYRDAFVDANEVVATVGTKSSANEQMLSESGISVDSQTDAGSIFSVRDLLDDSKKEKVAKALATRFGVTVEEAMQWLTAETSLASLILNPKYSQYLDYTADSSEEAIKSNSDYPQGTVDFSNICKKRRDFTEVMNRVLRNFPNHMFMATDLAKIRSIMEEEKMEVACAICYVEDRRQLDSIVAQDFIDSLALYREGSKTRPDGKPFNTNQLKALKLVEGDTYTPSIYELISLEGRNALKAKNSAMNEAWVKFNNARGMQSVRLLLNDAEYKRQILKYNKNTVKSKNDHGGLRIYSFSDMEMFHLIDIIQVITDSATVGLSLQGYTKVNEYAKAVKDTGEKLNRSLIPKGDLGYHIEDGKVILDFDTVEGIDINHKDFFDSTDNPNVGNIVIGINKKQIQAAMVSKFIDQIIPFHTGQSKEVLGEKGIATWNNYKDSQTEKDLATGNTAKHQINIYTEVFQAAEKEGKPITNKVEFVNKFLEVCKENNLEPRFSEFLNTDENGNYVYTEGYHKFLVDFKTFDQNTGEYLPQMPVKPIFDNQYITQLLKDYVKSQKVKDAHLASTMPKVLERITNEIVTPNETMFSDRDSDEAKAFARDINQWNRDERPNDESFVLGSTGDVLQGLGAIESDIYMLGEKINEILLNHPEMTLDEIKKIPQILENPILILKSRGEGRGNRQNTRLVIFGSVKAKDNRPILSILDLRPQEDNLVIDDMQKVTSAYTKDNNPVDFVRNSDVLYADKNKTTKLLRTIGFQTPIELQLGGYIGSISYKGQNVNIEGESFSKVFKEDSQIHYSERDLAPTFYSQMGKVVEGVKQEKLGANSVVNMLRGKGVKAEEIRWSGIVPFLEGKKSVTKQELLDFINGSMLQIGEQMSNEEGYGIVQDGDNYIVLGNDGTVLDTWEKTVNPDDPEMVGWISREEGDIASSVNEIREYSSDWYGGEGTRWSQYRLDGGSNYRELVFTMPNSTYTNQAMKAHWGYDAEGILAHARIQDFDVNGKKMLFIEEIQSDYHNEGHQTGYQTTETDANIDKLKAIAEKKFFALEDYSTELTGYAGEWEAVEQTAKGAKLLREYREAQDAYDNAMNDYVKKIPDAPFKDNYHEYVLKRLLRMAAENGYDSIGWTTADIQSERWSNEYAEGYRIEYDQDIPKFLKKYGRQWGAKVDKTALPGKEPISETLYDVNRAQVYHSMSDWKKAIKKELRIQGLSAREVNSINFVKDGEYVVVYGRDGIEYDRAKVFTEDNRVWSMELTDSMKESVLYEGQVMYSERVTDEKTLDFLNEQIDNGEYITVYRSFQVIDGGLYAPMNAMDRDENGKNKKLGYRSEIGVWEQATESRAIAQRYMDTHPDAPYAKFNLDGGDNKTNDVAYNPYLHASNLVLNDQFSAAYRRNLVTVECRVPLSEAEGTYKADYAKDGTGWANWKAGGVAGQLKKIKPEFERRLFLSRYMLPVKILSDAEVAQMYKDYLGGTNISVPWNVVTPSLRKELEKVGVNISYKDVKQGNGLLKFEEQFPEEVSKVLYSDRDTDTSNRSILANALESVAQNDIERNKLAQYKEKISLIEAEEQKLSEIQKQLFTKGGVEPSQRKDLQFEAKQIANRINTYDRQLLNLESTTALKNVLNREKALAMKRQKQKDTEYLKQYKEKVAKDKKILLERHQESRKKAIKGREKTAMRHKIQKVVGDLNNLLLKPSKERHVPEEMRIAVAEALAIVNMDTVDADTRVAKYNDLIAKATDPDVIASLTESRDRILNQGNKLAEKLTKLKDAYGMIRDSADDSLRSMYDDVIYNRIETVQKKVGKTPIRNMSLEQLESVYELYKMVLTFVRDSNQAFAENLKMTRLALGSNTFAEIKENNKARDRIKHEAVERFLWQNLKPMQAMKTIGSGTLQKLWNNILYGQEVFAQDYDEAVKFAKEMKDKYGYKKWNLKKLHSFESKSGKTMKISLEQMMSIYAYSKRQQADEHIEFGGIVLNEGIIEEKNKLGKTVKVKVNDSTAYRLDKMQVGEIIATLEREAPGAKAFVDEMQKYLSETMGAKGNEVAMKMYGIKLFKEEHYFPLKSSKDFMEAANAKLKGDVKIKNKGMTKSVVEHARNPIVLENFLDVWGNHINEMAMYHGLVLPLEDFSRTLNYSFKADEKLNTDAESVRTALHDAFGDSADNYLNELLKAINGGVLHDSSAQFADKMISKFKKAKVMASLSVVVQQPTAIVRSMGIIEPKYFVAQNFSHKATWEELKKYCPTAIIKETGSFDTNMGRTIVDMIKEDSGFTDKVGDVLGKVPAYMDEVGWNMIWRALKKKVATEQKLSGEELLKECGKQMTLIINETQVYDSVLSRNELMRSKSAFTKMATAFMAEPLTVANMIYGAVLDFKRGNKAKASKDVVATITSVVITGLVSSLVYAPRDDDEEKTWLEKYLSSATTEVLDGLNPLTYIPFVKDAYSLFQGYDVERTDMALIGDVVDAVDAFYKVLNPEEYEDMCRKEIAKHIYENAKPLLTSICDMFGLPVGNILRDAEAIIVNDNVPMSQTSSSGIGYALKEGWLSSLPAIVGKIVGNDSKQDKLYKAIIKGDTAYIERLKSGYKDDKAFETAVRKALRENDSRIREAAEARIGGNIAEYSRIVKEIKAEGYFSQDTIVASVNAEINAINKDAGTEETSSTNKSKSMYTMDDYYASIVGRDQASAYVVKEDIINTDVANGKDREEAESNFNSRFASHLREEFENGYLSESEAENMLVNYGGKTEEDASSRVQYWAFKKEYPDYDDLSEEAVDKYYNEVEPHGISIDVYYDYYKQRSNCKGVDANKDGKTDSGSVKKEVLKVINSLPLTKAQKDALYYLNGWSKKTLYEAPWR